MNQELSGGLYALLFLDVLGQRRLLREIKTRPESADEVNRNRELIVETAGTVLRMRDAHRRYVASFHRGTDLGDSLSPELEPIYEKMRKSSFNSRFVSDSLIVEIPLRRDNEFCTAMRDLYCTFIAASTMFVAGLGDRHPVRGAIEVGVGVELTKGEVYGPVLERAYYLEHEFADYPRILIGGELYEFLEFLASRPSTSPFGLMSRSTAQSCRELIYTDDDGRYALDYLSPARASEESRRLAQGPIGDAIRFVKSDREKHERNNDQKHLARNRRLTAYFAGRLGAWGIDPGELEAS